MYEKLLGVKMIEVFTNKWLLGFLLIGVTIMLACVFHIIWGTYKIIRKRITDPNPQKLRRLV